MRFVGGKFRIKKQIAGLIISKMHSNNQMIIEPFCGGCWITQELIKAGYRNIKSSDFNYYLIEMYKALQKGWVPPDVSKLEYYNIRKHHDSYKPFLVGFAGFNYCFGSVFFTGYVDCFYKKNRPETMVKEGETLRCVEFNNFSYEESTLSRERALIYCDPPYMNSTGYASGTTENIKKLQKFNHEKFFEWCEEMKDKGNTVLVSESEIIRPRFKLILEIKRSGSLNNSKLKDRYERVYEVA